MRLSMTAAAMLVAAAGLLTVPADEAWARKKSSGVSAVKTPKAKRSRSRSGSEESTAERDRRLSRECKGLPNAGACLGYAS